MLTVGDQDRQERYEWAELLEIAGVREGLLDGDAVGTDTLAATQTSLTSSRLAPLLPPAVPDARAEGIPAP